MRGAAFLVFLLWAASGAAQTMYKCLDDQRRITYSNITCEKQGLRDGGPVADRTTSMPFTDPVKSPTVKLTPPLTPPSESSKAPSEKLTK